MECCAGGDLFKALEHLGNPTQNWCAAVAAQAFRGVAYLHEQFQQSHNDIKPENILLDHAPLNSSDVPRVMIGDFGCARSSGSASINTDPTVGGDPRYRAPETWKGAPFGVKSDVWSLGVTLFELLSGGQLIYIYQRNISGWSGFCAANEGKLYQKFIVPAQRGDPVKVKSIDGDAARSVLTGLLDVKPEKRFTMEQALKQQWFELANSTTTVSFGPKAAQLLRARAKCSKLRVGLLNLVGSMLQGESLKYYNEIWSQYDAGGVMTLSQFEDMFNGSGLGDGALYPSFSGPSAQDVFNMADGDGDGQISFDEFVAIMFNPDELDEAQRIEYLKAAFKILANDNDEITVEAMRGLFVDQNIEVLTELFQDIDADGSGVVDYDEFAAYIEGI
jgi:serine/threonine protein kinase